MNRLVLFAGILAACSGCVGNPAATQPALPGGDSTRPVVTVLREAKHSPDLKVAQTLSPDAGALSILFDNLQANADANQIGGASIGALLAIPVDGDAGTARVSIDARGQLSSRDGDCEIALLTPGGGTRHWSDADGSFVLNLAADVPVPFVFRVAVNGLCWATKDAAFALLAVDSLDVTIERRPTARAVAPTGNGP